MHDTWEPQAGRDTAQKKEEKGQHHVREAPRLVQAFQIWLQSQCTGEEGGWIGEWTGGWEKELDRAVDQGVGGGWRGGWGGMLLT